MTRVVVAALAALLLLGATGCTQIGVVGYGDSLIARSTDWPANNTVARANASGESIISNFSFNDGNVQVSSLGWAPAVATTLASNPYAGGLDANIKAQVVVYSFGTNDATERRIPVAQTMALAQGWIDRAYGSGAKCVIWIRPNNWTPYLSGGDLTAYRDYVDAFNGWLAAKANGSAIFKVIDWPGIINANPAGYSFDRLHPNAAGGALIGQQILANAKVCGN